MEWEGERGRKAELSEEGRLIRSWRRKEVSPGEGRCKKGPSRGSGHSLDFRERTRTVGAGRGP